MITASFLATAMRALRRPLVRRSLNPQVFSEDGRGTVLKAGREFREVAVNKVPGMGTTACPAVSNGAIFVRGATHLYKIQ